MRHILKHGTAALAVLCLAAASLGTLVTIPSVQVASVAVPVLA